MKQLVRLFGIQGGGGLWYIPAACSCRLRCSDRIYVKPETAEPAAARNNAVTLNVCARQCL